MRKNKKIFSLLMVCVLCIGMLAGCGKDEIKLPTAEELMSAPFGTSTEVTSLDVALNADMQVKVDMSAVGMNEAMDMACTMNVNMAGNNDGNFSTKGQVGYDILGMNGIEQVETYEIVDANGGTVNVYAYNDETDTWSRNPSTNKNGDEFVSSILDMVDMELFEKDTMVFENGAEFYHVKGVIKSANLKNSILALSKFIGNKNLISNDISFNVTMDFDKVGHYLKAIHLSLDVENSAEEVKAVYQKVAMDIAINQINNVSIVVPTEVLDAVDGTVAVPEATEAPILDGGADIGVDTNAN